MLAMKRCYYYRDVVWMVIEAQLNRARGDLAIQSASNCCSIYVIHNIIRRDVLPIK